MDGVRSIFARQLPDDRALSIYTLMSRVQRRDPLELFEYLARNDPVHWDPYAGVWMVSGRRAALTVCTDERFSALRLSSAVPQPGLSADDVRERVLGAVARQALFLDGPAHGVWRPILHRVLAADRVQALTPWINRRLHELIPDSCESLDVVSEVARPLPLEVIGQLLGLPAADLSVIRQWSDAYTRIVTGIDPVTDRAVFTQVSEFLDYALALVRTRRGWPTDDGISVLIHGADLTGTLDDLDIASNLIMLIAAGHQTTTGFISGAVLELLRPGFGPFANEPSQETTVDELLARVSPSRFVGRRVLIDAELAGKQLRAGQSVLVLLAAVNWHEHATSSRHIAFGWGSHHCPGARLARLEGRLVLERLFPAGHPPVLRDNQIPWTGNINLPCPARLDVAVAGPAGSPHDDS